MADDANGARPALVSKWAALTHYISAKEYNALRHDLIASAYWRGIDISKQYKKIHDNDSSKISVNMTRDTDISSNPNVEELFDKNVAEIEKELNTAPGGGIGLVPEVKQGQIVYVKDLKLLQDVTDNTILYDGGSKDVTADSTDTDGNDLKVNRQKYHNPSNISKPLALLYNEIRQTVVDINSGAGCVNCSTACKSQCATNCYTDCAGVCTSGNCMQSCGTSCLGRCYDLCKTECGMQCQNVCGGSCINECHTTCTGAACSNMCDDANCDHTCQAVCMYSSCGGNCSGTCGNGSCSNNCTGSCMQTCGHVCGLSNCNTQCDTNCSVHCGTACGGNCAQDCVTSCSNVCSNSCSVFCGGCGAACTYYSGSAGTCGGCYNNGRSDCNGGN